MLWANHYTDRLTLYLAYNRELFLDTSAAALLAGFVERCAMLARDPNGPCVA
jgi:hypothetical protein